ncbi:PqqD family protein [Prevotella sp. 20925_1_30]|uniref:PqqD family protein n=1 Tax=Prevotella sp. 20925_1_30 TaxID=3003679 RepID=UPI0028D33809|nr:PqqD family protein [uncultured Prevotella sp.]
MKVKNGFNLREVCGENIIVAEGDENIDFSNIISMNESSAYLWQEVQKLDNFTIETLTQLLCEQYEIDEATAKKDVTTLATQWAAAGIIEGEDMPEVKVEMTQDKKDIEPKKEQETNEEGKKKGFFKRIFG